MKIALLADIHANLVGLEATAAAIAAWQPDQVIVAGDLINRGPQPRQSLAFLQQRAAHDGWLLLRGNHEEYVLRHDRERAQLANNPIIQRWVAPVAWTWQQVADQIGFIDALPESHEDHLYQARMTVRHASIHHNRDGLLMRHSDDELAAKIDPQADIFCTAHTHMPFVRRIGAQTVINVGSAGLPFDGDVRPAYAQLTYRERHGWHAAVVRVDDYDHAAAMRAFDLSGLTEAGGPIAAIMRRESATGLSLLYDFVNEYGEAVRHGQIALDDAVDQFVATLG